MIKISGKYVNLRNVSVSDAEFILSLRCDDKKSRFLHKTENDIEKQRQYIKSKENVKDEWYFIIENKNNVPIGTYRIYDLRPDSFCIGSWLMIDGVSPQEMLEADFLVRNFGFDTLGMNKMHFDVRKENKKVWTYHKLVGAKQVGETELDYLFECDKQDFLNGIKRFL